MEFTDKAICFFAGLFFLPAMQLSFIVLMGIKWATKDTLWIWRNGTIKPGHSKLIWPYLLAKEFALTFFLTIRDELRGLRRTA